MRQAGIVAAGALYALDHHVDRLAEDHANAAHAGARDRCARARGRRGRDQHRRSSSATTPRALCAALEDHEVRMGAVGPAAGARRHAPGCRRRRDTTCAGRARTRMCAHEARRHPPHHRDHRRCPAQRRLLRARAGPADGQEVRQPGRPDRLPPLLRRRERVRRRRPDVLRVPERPRRTGGCGDGPPDRAPRGVGGHAGLLGRPARLRGRRRSSRVDDGAALRRPGGPGARAARRRRARTRRWPPARPRSRTSTRCRASTRSTRRSRTRASRASC